MAKLGMGRSLLAFISILALAACVAGPVVKGASRKPGYDRQIGNAILIFRQSELKVVSSSGVPEQQTYVTDHGFANFGDAINRQAPSALQAHGLTVKQVILVKGNASARIPSAPDPAVAILDVTLKSVNTTASRNAANASYEFDVSLFDLPTHGRVWRTTLDAQLYSGRGYLLDDLRKTNFDDEYAKKLLGAIGTALERDGLIKPRN